jgi:hypothetical protein
MTYIVPSTYPGYWPPNNVPNYYPSPCVPNNVYENAITTSVISAKTTQEIRTELLILARQMLQEEFRIKEEKYNVMLEAYLASHNDMPHLSDLKKFIKDYSPKMYSVDDLVERFDQLYNFVTNNTTTNQTLRK